MNTMVPASENAGIGETTTSPRFGVETVYEVFRVSLGLSQKQAARRSGMRLDRLREIEWRLDTATEEESEALAATWVREIQRRPATNDESCIVTLGQASRAARKLGITTAELVGALYDED